MSSIDTIQKSEIFLPSFQNFLVQKGLSYDYLVEKYDTYAIHDGMLICPIYEGNHPKIQNGHEFTGGQIFGIRPNGGNSWTIADTHLGNGIGTTNIDESELFNLNISMLDYMAQFMPGGISEQKRLLFIQYCEYHFGIELLKSSKSKTMFGKILQTI